MRLKGKFEIDHSFRIGCQCATRDTALCSLFLVDDEDENGLIETGDILRDAPVAANQDAAVQHKILEVAFAMDESIKQQLGDDANEIFLLMGHIVSF